MYYHILNNSAEPLNGELSKISGKESYGGTRYILYSDCVVFRLDGIQSI